MSLSTGYLGKEAIEALNNGRATESRGVIQDHTLRKSDELHITDGISTQYTVIDWGGPCNQAVS